MLYSISATACKALCIEPDQFWENDKGKLEPWK